MCLIDDGVVLRGGLSRSVGVSMGLALEVPGVDGRLWNEAVGPSGPRPWCGSKEANARGNLVVIRSAHRGRHVTPIRRFLMVSTIGIDPHKATQTAVAIDEAEVVLG